MEQVCLGIDVGGTAVKAGIFTAKGELLQKWEFATKKTEDGKDLVRDVAESVMREADRLHIEKANIIGIGIGLPGPIRQDGEVLDLTNLGRGYFNVEAELERLTGVKAKAGNDANVAALGEQWKGGGQGYNSMVLVTLGTGVGGGIILNGSILAGSNGSAGEIGHIFVEKEETDVCGCGKSGCLEQYASATGIVRMARNFISKSSEPSKLRQEKQIDAKVIFDCAREKDALALAIVEKACSYLGIALAQVAQVVDPEAFVIGGGVSKAGTILTHTIQKYYNRHVMQSLKDKKFELAKLGNDAGIYGAAKLVLSSDGLGLNNLK
jgi:glucokinase